MSEAEPGNASPEISVILVFHSRVEFLPSALQSLLRQTVPPGKFEVVVVGPERPPGWSDRDANPSIRFTKSNGVSLGAKIAQGLRESRGKVVAFLEDDDLYEPTKLSFVDEAFQSDSSLTYIQHGFRVINEGGKSGAPNDLHVRIMRTWRSRGVVRVPGMPTSRELKVVRGVPVGFNTSSIAIRRSVVSDRLGLIEDVGMLVDVTLLYLSLLLPGHLRFDPIPLTSFRKHSASNSDPQLNDSTAFLTRMRDYLQKAQKSREYLVRYVSTHGSIALIRSIEGQQAIGRLILDLRSPATSRSERGRSIVAALSRWRTFEVSRYWPAFPLGLLCFLSPRFGSKAYFLFRRKREGYG